MNIIFYKSGVPFNKLLLLRLDRSDYNHRSWIIGSWTSVTTLKTERTNGRKSVRNDLKGFQVGCLLLNCELSVLPRTNPIAVVATVINEIWIQAHVLID